MFQFRKHKIKLSNIKLVLLTFLYSDSLLLYLIYPCRMYEMKGLCIVEEGLGQKYSLVEFWFDHGESLKSMGHFFLMLLIFILGGSNCICGETKKNPNSTIKRNKILDSFSFVAFKIDKISTCSNFIILLFDLTSNHSSWQFWHARNMTKDFLGDHNSPAVFRVYSWLFAQGSLVLSSVSAGDQIRVDCIKRQAPYLLAELSLWTHESNVIIKKNKYIE